ncbi:unnamed protein product, partial [Nesidiocoris tenuis]
MLGNAGRWRIRVQGVELEPQIVQHWLIFPSAAGHAHFPFRRFPSRPLAPLPGAVSPGGTFAPLHLPAGHPLAIQSIQGQLYSGIEHRVVQGRTTMYVGISRLFFSVVSFRLLSSLVIFLNGENQRQAPTPNSGLVGTPCTSRGASPPLRLSLVHVRFTRRSSRSRSVNTHTRAARLSPIRIRRFAAPKCGTGAVPDTSAARPSIGQRPNTLFNLNLDNSQYFRCHALPLGLASSLARRKRRLVESEHLRLLCRLRRFYVFQVCAKGSADFLGLNYYTMLLAKPGLAGLDPSDQRDSRVVTLWDPSWKPTVASWLRVAPEGLRMLLNKVKNDYGNPEVLITENGYPDDGSDPLNDTERINYYE